MIGYRIKVEPDDNGTLLITCPALPEVTTFAASRNEVQVRARAAIGEALAARIADGENIPEPEKAPTGVRLPLQAVLKVMLYLAMGDVTRAELARRLHWHREQVDRLFRLDHASRLDQVDAAFVALHRDVDVSIHEMRH